MKKIILVLIPCTLIFLCSCTYNNKSDNLSISKNDEVIDWLLINNENMEDVIQDYEEEQFVEEIHAIEEKELDNDVQNHAITPTWEEYFEFDSIYWTITWYSSEWPKNVLIPSKIWWVKVINIWDEAFLGGGMDVTYNQISSVIIPNTVISIWKSAFAYNNLTSIIIPNSVIEIWVGAFGNNQLKSVEISNNIMDIPAFVFASNDIVNITIPNSVVSIGEQAFSGNNPENIILQDNIENIWSYAFYSNGNNTWVIYWPESLKNKYYSDSYFSTSLYQWVIK